ncbi:CRISPR-associated protein [filamentous cyanobacterium CCP2]|nr:CRISPR-associated protein [filamentous cyanobacterium CCP2]
MRNTLLCTVGTSLLNNIKPLDLDDPIHQAFDTQNWIQLVLLLLDQQNISRLCGAEINSITRICQQGYLADRAQLIFLVSDTSDGKDTGIILQQYYSHSKNPLRFRSVESRTLEGLKDDSVKQFKQEGLKNLVREISKEVRKRSSETIAINATGGYKAQISFAGMIGQALEIPVYYLFEKFSDVIELPPQPVSLDLTLWLNHYGLFEELETHQTLPKSQVQHDLTNDYLQSMVEEVEIDDVTYVTLSAMGELFHDRCRFQFTKQETTLLSLIPRTALIPSHKTIKLSDTHHGNVILQKFAEKLCKSQYVVGVINSLPFNPKQRNSIRRTYANGLVEFVLIWTDAGLGLCIQTTGRNLAETNTIALHLEREFSGC